MTAVESKGVSWHHMVPRAALLHFGALLAGALLHCHTRLGVDLRSGTSLGERFLGEG